jgi:MtN3 and saliva related transmembrane protein
MRGSRLLTSVLLRALKLDRSALALAELEVCRQDTPRQLLQCAGTGRQHRPDHGRHSRGGAQPFGLEETTMAGARWGVNQFNKATPTIFLPCIIVLCGCQDPVPHDTQSLLDPNLKRSEILGLAAGFGTTFAAVPDLIAMFRRRSSAGMNPRMAAIMGAFQILWVYYGLLIASRPVILWNVVAVLVNFVSVDAYFYFVGKEKRSQYP